MGSHQSKIKQISFLLQNQRKSFAFSEEFSHNNAQQPIPRPQEFGGLYYSSVQKHTNHLVPSDLFLYFCQTNFKLLMENN
ncbi:MAG: hypothetical protein II834_07740, partial [Bacteroidaceae bacterium]|nr:hypothetical protein [Bacteroidaceae bacterium]